MSLIRIKDATDPATWGPAIDEAVNAVGRGELVVLPTDTVYGLGADAFDPRAVQALLDAKGRGRQMPPPVLIPDARTLDGLATDVPAGVRALAEAFWPGGLTIILRAQPSLAWDLGETRGTVALRMPDHPVALAVLRRTGPLAVSSANLTGRPSATTVQEAYRQLGAKVPVFLDGGAAPGGVASTIVDATGDVLRIVRLGALDVATLAAVAPVMAPAPPTPAADDVPDTDDAPDDGARDEATGEAGAPDAPEGPVPGADAPPSTTP